MAHLGYLHTAKLVVLGIWSISWGRLARCTGVGGAGSARFSFGDPLQEGPVAAGGSQTRCQRDGSAEAQRWVFAWCKQVLWQELVPFGILAGGWAREMALASAFVPRQTELCHPGAQQLSLPLSSILPAFRAELLTYDLPDGKSRLLSEHTPSGPSAFAIQTQGLCLAGGLPLRPAPSRQSVQRALPLCPSYPLLRASRLHLAPETPFC